MFDGNRNIKMLSIKFIMLLILLLMIKTIQAMPSMNDLNGKDKCERITITSCHELQYNHTMMPNLAGHMNVIEADDMVSLMLLNVIKMLHATH